MYAPEPKVQPACSGTGYAWQSVSRPDTDGISDAVLSVVMPQFMAICPMTVRHVSVTAVMARLAQRLKDKEMRKARKQIRNNQIHIKLWQR